MVKKPARPVTKAFSQVKYIDGVPDITVAFAQILSAKTSSGLIKM